MFQDRDAFSAGINQYVPKMAYSAAMAFGANWFSLGAPAASDDDLVDASIDADATAGTEETVSWTSDSPYGRNLILTPSGDPGAAGGVLDVYGYDYLGQPMVERFTGANGSTAILYGKKAFYQVFKTKIVTAATNAITYKLGTGTRLGLPYKGKVKAAKEDNAIVRVYDAPFYTEIFRDTTDAAAGCSKWIASPCPGYVSTLRGAPDGGGSTNDPVITVELGGTAITGLTITIDTSDTAGLTVSDTPTTVGYRANNRLVTGSLIEVIGAAAASAKGDRLGIEITPMQVVAPDLTDPQTVTTGDPRGTYEALLTYNGSKTIEVLLEGDPSVNSSSNGGLHGIRHVVS